jgi:SAM-dependent methyltransferase
VRQLDPITTYLAVSDRERRLGLTALREAEAIAVAGGVRRGARVLDAGAGQGWHAIALARRFTTVGIDAARPLVLAGQRRVARRMPHARPRLLVATAEAVPYADASFDLAYSVHTSLGYGELDDDLAVLTELRRVLRPGAALVLQAISASEAAEDSDRACRFPDGARVVYEPRFDESRSLLRERQRLELPSGGGGSFRFAVHAYEPSELLALAVEAGLRKPRVYGDLELGPWREGDPVVLLSRAPV